MVLSKREKILLYILALLVILLASWTYIINPVLNANRQAKLEYEAAQAEREQMEMLMPSLIGADSRLSDEKIRALSDSYFYKNLRDTQIDRMLQQTAYDSGVTLTSVTINPAQMGPVAARWPTAAPRLWTAPLKVRKAAVKAASHSICRL